MNLDEICAANNIVAMWFKDLYQVRVRVKTCGLPFVERNSLQEAVEAMLEQMEERRRHGWKGDNLGFNYKW